MDGESNLGTLEVGSATKLIAEKIMNEQFIIPHKKYWNAIRRNIPPNCTYVKDQDEVDAAMEEYVQGASVFLDRIRSNVRGEYRNELDEISKFFWKGQHGNLTIKDLVKFAEAGDKISDIINAVGLDNLTLPISSI
jgi:hypothetical protein